MNDNRKHRPDPYRRDVSDRRELTEREAIRCSTTKFRRKKPSLAGMAAALFILMLAVLIAACVYNIVTRGEWQDAHRSAIADSLMISESEADLISQPDIIPFTDINVPDTDMYCGDLILVNFEHEYVFPEDESALASIYENKNDCYKVAYTSYMLNMSVIGCFNKLITELEQRTGDTCLLVNSSYRSFEDQTDVYRSFTESSGAEYAEQYVAQPGKSEHHTGLALDLTVRYDDGTSVLMKNYENLQLFNLLSIEYGFVQRYPENKYDYTHINTEPWHYRYVGVPHAYVMYRLGMCLEEYIDYIRAYTADGRILTVAGGTGKLGECDRTALPEDGYAVYFQPASETGETALPIPTSSSSYDVSGNNVDGFIVTAVFGNPILPELTADVSEHNVG